MNLETINAVLYKNNIVRGINIQLDTGDYCYHLFLELGNNPDLSDTPVVIDFEDISGLTIDNFGGGISQFMHPEVSIVDRGLERIRYSLQENEHRKISFYFKNMVIT